MKKGLIFALITAIVFTTLEPVSKNIAEVVNPYSITAIRFLISAIILLPFSFATMKKKNLKLNAKDFSLMGGLGVLVICLSMVLLQVAVKKADNPSLIAIIFSSNSVFTILLSAIILKTELTLKKIIAIICCCIGVLFCADFSKGGSNLFSVLLAVLASLTFSLYTVITKKYMTKIGGVVQSGFAFTIGSIVLIIILLICGISPLPDTAIMAQKGITMTNVWLNLIYLGIVVTGIGYWAYFKALEKDAMMAAFAFFIKPVLTPFATHLLTTGISAGEVLKPQVFVAIAFVVAGSYLSTFSGNIGKKAN